LTALLAAEAISHFGLRNWINRSLFKGARPEMLVDRVSDSNFMLLYLFWPLVMYFMARRWIAAVIAMVLTIVGLSFVVDTNAQILALVVSAITFFCVKHWPRDLWRRRIAPERVMAVLVGAFLLAFPFVILALVRSRLLGAIAPHVGASSQARFGIWEFAVLEASRKPIWGWGYESARNFEPIIPDHPHSPAIQAWLEMGIPGLLLVAAIWFFIFWCLAPKGEGAQLAEDKGLVELSATQVPTTEDTGDQRARPYVLALAVTFFVVNAISYGIWRDWLYTQGAFSAAAMMLSIKAVKHLKKFQI
jgi:O-antigen ligase